MVQGLTEFLPVSSSGHLLLAQYFLGLNERRFGLAFDAALHLGTALAVLLFFWRDILRLARAFLRSLRRGPDFLDLDERMAYMLIVASIPAVIIGGLFEGFFATAVRSPWVVVFTLVLVGALFLVGEAVGLKRRRASKLSFVEAFGIGLAQAASLVPGVSRSGATITLGLFLGLRREEAARFSFLMSFPITTGAGLLSLAQSASGGMGAHQVAMFVAGCISAALVGYLAIRFLLNYLAGHSLRVFAYYRFGLAAFVALLLLIF